MKNKIELSIESLSKAHKINRILSIHRKLARVYHEFDMLKDEESMEVIQKAQDPINELLTKLLNSVNT